VSIRVSIIVLVALTGVAAGEPIPAKARDLAQQGRAFHDKGDYARAIAAFKEAYVIAPSPALLFNLAQAYRLQGNCDDAALMYRRYIGTYPSQDGRMLAEGHLATVDRCISKRSMNIPMDNTAAYLNVTAPPKDLGIVDDPVEPHAGRLKKRVGMGLAIGGGAALVAATYFGVRAHNAAQEVEALSARGAKAKDIQAVDERGQNSAAYAKVLGVTGAVAATTGIALYVLGVRDERATAFAIAPTKTGGEVSYAWQF